MRPLWRKTAHASRGMRLRRSQGFTFIEAIIVVSLIAILSAIAMPRGFETSSPTLPAQARTLVADLQRAQWLAANSGDTVFVCLFNGGYVLQQGSYAIGQDCPASLPTQVSDTQPVVAELDNAVSLSATPPGTLSYDSLGQPSSNVAYTLSGDNDTQTINVTATSGMLTWGAP